MAKSVKLVTSDITSVLASTKIELDVKIDIDSTWPLRDAIVVTSLF